MKIFFFLSYFTEKNIQEKLKIINNRAKRIAHKNDMKQKLKEKINVGDKVKKPSFQKCVKMSKEFENLKNGDSVISNHTQQQQKLNNNLNVDREATTKAIVGGRLQFYKGNFLLLPLI